MAPDMHERDSQEVRLGAEFLLWLWWCAETRGGTHELAEGAQVGIALDRLLDFRDEDTGVVVQVRGEAPTRAPEAREALARGMRLLRTGLIVTVDDVNVSVVLDAETFDLRSLRAEGIEGDTREERDQAALAAMFGLAASLDAVYGRFLAERTARTFMKEGAPALLAWMRAARRGRSRRPQREAVNELAT